MSNSSHQHVKLLASQKRNRAQKRQGVIYAVMHCEVVLAPASKCVTQGCSPPPIHVFRSSAQCLRMSLCLDVYSDNPQEVGLCIGEEAREKKVRNAK